MGINDTEAVENVTLQLEVATKNEQTSGDVRACALAVESVAKSRQQINATVSHREVDVNKLPVCIDCYKF